MFGTKKKLLAKNQALKEENQRLCNELVNAEEINDEYEALQKKYDSLEIENQLLKAKNSKLTEDVAHYESLSKITDIEAQLKSNQLKHDKIIAEKNNEIHNLIVQNRKLISEVDLLKLKMEQSFTNDPKNIDANKLTEDNLNYSKTNAKLNAKISEFENGRDAANQRAEENFQRWLEADRENRHLRTIFKRPKNSKFKCEYTSQYKVKVTTEKGRSSLYNADIFIVNYSLYSFNETGYCMKETKECKYFLERFYWPHGGYISFNNPNSKKRNSTLQLLPDGTPSTFIGSDNKEYSISFTLDFMVEPTEAQLLQFTVRKNSLSELLKESKILHKSLGALFDKIRHSIDNLGVDLPLQADILRELNSLAETYRELEKEFKNYTKNANEKFKSKFEKIK